MSNLFCTECEVIGDYPCEKYGACPNDDDFSLILCCKREIRKEFERRLIRLRHEINKTLKLRDPHKTGLFPAIYAVFTMCYCRNYRDLTKPYHHEEEETK